MAPGALCSSTPSSSFRRPVDQSSAGGDHRFGGPLLPMTKKQSKTRTCLQLGQSVSPLVYVCGAARRTYEIEKAHGLSGRPATAIRASDSLNEPCFNFLAGRRPGCGVSIYQDNSRCGACTLLGLLEHTGRIPILLGHHHHHHTFVVHGSVCSSAFAKRRHMCHRAVSLSVQGPPLCGSDPIDDFLACNGHMHDWVQ